jgi:hypothetical protein
MMETGWLEAPSYMDLTELKFVTTSDPFFVHGDDDYDDAFNDDDFNDDGAPGDVFTQVPTDAAPDEEPDDGKDVETSPPTPAPVTEAPATAQADGTDTLAPSPGPTPGDDGDAPTGEGGDGDAVTSPPTDGGDGDGDTATTPPTDGDGGNRTRLLEGGNGGGITQRTTQVLDFVVFLLPEDCEKNDWGGCSWAALGIGATDDEVEGEISYCCSEDTVARNLCGAEDLGKLIVNHDIFKGDHRKVDVPTDEDTQFHLDDPVFKQDVSGDYIMVLGNCDDYGMDVLTIGDMEWKSLRGNLPGDMYDLMLFYVALTFFYFLLALSYGCGMKIYQEAAIPIQKYIAATIVLGLFELTFRALDLGIWNAVGYRQEYVAYACKCACVSLQNTFLKPSQFRSSTYSWGP